MSHSQAVSSQAGAPPARPAPDPSDVAAAPLLPDRLPVARYLDPAAALAYRTSLHEHLLSVDGKAAGILTLLGLMFTVTARFGTPLQEILQQQSAWPKLACGFLLALFAGSALGTVIQSFRTIAPRFPKAPPSLAFFGDIARLTRDDYVRRMRELSPDTALEQILIYNHTSSLILVSKFKQLALGLRFFRVSAGCWVLLVVVVAWRMLHG